MVWLRNLSAKSPHAHFRLRSAEFQIRRHPLQTPIPSSNSQSSMAPLKVGDEFPPAKFRYIAYTPETSDVVACGTVQEFDAQKEFKGKKVVLFAVPGAFTPGCQVKHLPPYVEHYGDFKKKGVDIVAVVSANDAYVLAAWTKANNAGDKLLGLSDTDAKFSKSIGWEKDLTNFGLGMRTGRYAIALDDLKVVYAEIEPAGDVGVSGAEAVLAKL